VAKSRVQAKIITVQLLPHHGHALLAAVVDRETTLGNVPFIIRTLLALLPCLLKCAHVYGLLLVCSKNLVAPGRGAPGPHAWIRHCRSLPLPSYDQQSFLSVERQRNTVSVVIVTFEMEVCVTSDFLSRLCSRNLSSGKALKVTGRKYIYHSRLHGSNNKRISKKYNTIKK